MYVTSKFGIIIWFIAVFLIPKYNDLHNIIGYYNILLLFGSLLVFVEFYLNHTVNKKVINFSNFSLILIFIALLNIHRFDDFKLFFIYFLYVFLVLNVLKTKKDLIYFCTTLFFVSFCASVFLGFLQSYIFGFRLFPIINEPLVKDSFVFLTTVNEYDPNFSARVLLVVLWTNVIMIYIYKNTLFYSLSLLATLCAILLTGSRSAYVSLLVSFLLFLFFNSSFRKTTLRLLTKKGVFLLFLTIVSLSFFYLTRSSIIHFIDALFLYKSNATYLIRYSLWISTYYYLIDSSLVNIFFGNADVSNLFQTIGMSPHNTYLYSFFKYGLLTTLICLYLEFRSVYRCFISPNATSSIDSIKVICFAGLSSVIIMSNTIFGDIMMYTLFFLVIVEKVVVSQETYKPAIKCQGPK